MSVSQIPKVTAAPMPYQSYPEYSLDYGYGGSGGFGPTNESLSLRQLLLPIWRWKWLIVLIVISAVILAAIIVSYVTPRYSAETVVVLENEKKGAFNFANLEQGLPTDSATIDSQIEIIRSKSVALKVIDQLNLLQHPEFNVRLLPAPETLSTGRDWPEIGQNADEGGIFTFVYDAWRGVVDRVDYLVYSMKYSLLQRSADAQVNQQDSPLYQGLSGAIGSDSVAAGNITAALPPALELALNKYQERLSVSQKGRSRAIAITFWASHPEIAATIANQIAQGYLQEQISQKYERLQTGNKWLDSRVSDLRANVAEAEQAIEDYRTRAGLLEGGRGTLVSQQITEINAQLVLVRSERAALESQVYTIRNLVGRGGQREIQSAADVLSSPLIVQLQEQQATLRRQRADLSANYGPKHPSMIRIESELRELNQKISDEVNKVVRRLNNDVTAVRSKEASILASMEALKEELGEVNKSEVQLRALQREADASRQILTNFLEVYKQTQTQEDRDILKADASVITIASPPNRASFPNKPLILGLAAFSGLTISGFLIVLLQQLDKGFRSGQQIEQTLGIRYLGMTPRVGSGSTKGSMLVRHVVERPDSALSEAFRSLYASIVLASEDQDNNIIMVTSSKPNEGKSTTAVTLARTIALTGKKVLLIDGDVRVSSISQFLDVEPQPGLTELLQAIVTFSQIVQSDEASGADVIPAGSFSSNVTGMVTDSTMGAVLMQARNQYDFVIMDCPPVMAVSESRLLAKLADGVVLAVKWGETPREAVAQAAGELRSNGCNLLGCFVTMVDVQKYAHYGFGDSGRYTSAEGKYYTR